MVCGGYWKYSAWLNTCHLLNKNMYEPGQESLKGKLYEI